MKRGKRGGEKGRKKKENKAGYTATPVACGWAGAVFEVTWSLGQEQWGRRPQKKKKKKVWRTDGRTDGRTDKVGCRVACTRLKTLLNRNNLVPGDHYDHHNRRDHLLLSFTSHSPGQLFFPLCKRKKTIFSRLMHGVMISMPLCLNVKNRNIL